MGKLRLIQVHTTQRVPKISHTSGVVSAGVSSHPRDSLEEWIKIPHSPVTPATYITLPELKCPIL